MLGIVWYYRAAIALTAIAAVVFLGLFLAQIINLHEHRRTGKQR